MDRSDILNALVDAINEYVGSSYAPDDVDLALPLYNYGVDSLNVLQILAAVGDAVGIEIDLSELPESTVTSIAALLEHLASLRDPAADSVAKSV